jgi:predicted nucleic acid-binding protein
MAMRVDKIFVDTNVLIYANDPLSPFNQAARAQLYNYAGSGFELWISRQIIREYLSTKSRAMVLSNTYNAMTLFNDIQHFSTIFKIADESQNVTNELLRLVTSYNVGGKQVHDCNIVATMKTQGISALLTHNVADFKRYANENIEIIPILL